MKGSVWWRDRVPDKLGDGYTSAILEAIEADDHVLDWISVSDGNGLEFEITRAPLAIGTHDDHVYLLGVSGEAVDMIARALGNVMSPTPRLWDLAAEDTRQVQVGPHTLPSLIGQQNGAAGMTKSAAKAHADAIAKDLDGACSFISAAVKCNVLHVGGRDGYCAEYGWRLDGPVGWGSKNSSKTGWLVQPAQWAHFYRTFFDYSMGVILVKTAARLDGKPVDLRDLVRGAAHSSRVAPDGPVPFTIHPNCRDAVEGLSEPPDTDRSPVSGVGRFDLKYGDKSEDVAEWQRILIADGFSLAPYGPTGGFFRLTQNATIGWQRERGLKGSGVVDAATWALVGVDPPERNEPDGEITDYVPATNYTKANRKTVDNVVIHTIEIVEASYSADRTAAWLGSGARAPRASAHACIDDDSTIECVPQEHVAWAAPGLNKHGIQIEHAGFARQSLAEWNDPFSRRMLARSALYTAAACERWSIPPVFVDASGLLRGERGITTHYQVTKGPGKGRTNHYDPGRGFPMSTYIDMVKAAMS